MSFSRMVLAFTLFCTVLATAEVTAEAATSSPKLQLPKLLQGLGLRESAIASRDMPGWQKPQRIVVRNMMGQDVAARFNAAIPDVEIVGVSTVKEAVSAVRGAQVLIGFCDQAVFDAADQLHWVQVFWAGVEDCVGLPSMQAGDILLTNGQRLSSPAIAEYTIGVMFSLMRNLGDYYAAQIDHKWAPVYGGSQQSMGELSGRTMLVVGLGGIGTQVAQRANALGMRVLATRGSRREGPDFIEYVGLSDEVLTLAQKADVVVNATPLTPQTRGMFDAAFFEAMKPGAYFISVGRGQSTVSNDLVAALKEGKIAGAALDVTDPEPLPADHELWSAPRIIITPHISAQSPETMQRVGALVAENLRRYVAGQPLLSVVNVKRGY
jgi:phosphoglycerate dehydrogenase-like enzyme